jgi:hypothetical protein
MLERPSERYFDIQTTTEEVEVVKAVPNNDIELHPLDVIERVLHTHLDDEDVAILL